MPEPSIAAIVLAAGSSKRFGSTNKLLAEDGGRSVIESVLSNVAECEFDVVIVVTAPDHREIELIVQAAGFTALVNPHAASGMGSSIACGIKCLLQQTTKRFSGVAIYLGDMPSINSDTCRRLTEEFQQANGKRIVRPTYTTHQINAPGHPVLFPADLFGELEKLAGDAGAKRLIDANLHRLTEVNVADPGVTRDIDHPSDLSGQ